MEIKVEVDDIFKRYGIALDNLSNKAVTEMKRSLQNGGKRLATKVRRALKTQTGVLNYGDIVERVRDYFDDARFSYIIKSKGKGLPIESFEYEPKSADEGTMSSNLAAIRWSPRKHYLLQRRDAKGRFGPMPEESVGGGVKATMWTRTIPFARSFFLAGKGPRMQRVRGGRAIRAIYGPSLPKELIKDLSVLAFNLGAHTEVRTELEKRFAKMMPK